MSFRQEHWVIDLLPKNRKICRFVRNVTLGFYGNYTLAQFDETMSIRF